MTRVNGAEVGHPSVEEQQLKQNLPEDSTTESAPTSGLGKSLVNEDELTASYAMDTSVCRIIPNLACCVCLCVLSIPHASNHPALSRIDFKFPWLEVLEWIFNLDIISSLGLLQHHLPHRTLPDVIY
jgi:hypothetical protein